MYSSMLCCSRSQERALVSPLALYLCTPRPAPSSVSVRVPSACAQKEPHAETEESWNAGV